MSEIHSALVAAMQGIEPVAKDAENDFHHYRYVSAAAIEQAARDALAAQGLTVLCRYEVKRSEGDRVEVEAVLSLLHSSGEILENVARASMHGIDKGDKAIAKAQTGARKYALMSLLMIPSVDDPEADAKVDKVVAQIQAAPRWQPPVQHQPKPSNIVTHTPPQPVYNKDIPWFKFNLGYVMLKEKGNSPAGTFSLDVLDADALPPEVQAQIKTDQYGSKVWASTFDGDVYQRGFAIAGFDPNTGPATVLGFKSAVKPPVPVEVQFVFNKGYMNLAAIRPVGEQAEPEPDVPEYSIDELGPPLDMDDCPLSPGD